MTLKNWTVLKEFFWKYIFVFLEILLMLKILGYFKRNDVITENFSPWL